MLTKTATTRSVVLGACRGFLRPLARFLVRCGVSYREFAEVAKESFVEVVSEDYGIRGRQTNISRVAVLTGLTRKEVSRIRHAARRSEVTVGSTKRCRPEQVLEAWHRLEEYKGSDGLPLAIACEGEAPSFSKLVRLVGGDIPHGAMLKELLRAECVEETEAGLFRAVSKTFMPDATDPESIVLAGQALQDLVTTISSNLFVAKGKARMLERRVYSDRLSKGDSQQFEVIAEENAIKLLEELDDWIASHEIWHNKSRAQKKTVRIGLGVYLFRDRP